MTVNEIVAALSKSSLPTLLVEGDDDMLIWRRLEDDLGDSGISILQCWGRQQLLSVYDQRQAFTQLKCTFLADSDLWLFTGVPLNYRGILFTKGYSIENDLLEDFNYTRLLTAKEKIDFEQVRSNILPWYCAQIEDALCNREFEVDVHPNSLCPPPSSALASHYSFNQALIDPMLYAFITDNWELAVRGKTLFQLLVRYLSRKNRASKFSYNNLLEMGAKMNNGRNTQYLENRIRQKLA